MINFYFSINASINVIKDIMVTRGQSENVFNVVLIVKHAIIQNLTVQAVITIFSIINYKFIHKMTEM
jgi:hypothetical protein